MFKHKFFQKLSKKKDHYLNSLLKIKFKKRRNLSKIKVYNLNLLFSKKKLEYFTSYNRSSFLLIGIIIVALSYLSIPYFYNTNKLINKVERELSKNLNINFSLSKDFSYSFFPRPFFTFQKVSFLNQVENIGKIKVDISPTQLFFSEDIKIGNVTLHKVSFNINKKNYNFFVDLLKNDYSNFKFEIKNSNIFYNNVKNDILFINKINKLKYYYDKKKFSNFLIAESEIFNIPYFMKIQNNFEKKEINNSINSDLLKLKIENQFSYKNIEKKGFIKLFYNKRKSNAEYSLSKNSFKFSYSDKLLEPNFVYKGNINFKPFFSESLGNLKEISTNQLLNPNSVLVQFLKTEILNNKNLNIKTSVNANQIKSYKDLTNLILKVKISEGLIDINESSLSWLDYVDFKISDSLLYVKDNILILDAFIEIKINDYNEVYKFFQTPRNYRKKIKKVEFNLNYNFDQLSAKLNDIKIDNVIHEEVSKNLNQLIFKDNKLQNRIYFKNLMNQAIKNYAG